MSIDRVREVAHRLLVSTGALAALGAALELRIAGTTAEWVDFEQTTGRRK